MFARLALACLGVVALAGCATSQGNKPDWWRTNHTDTKVGTVRLVHLNIVAPPMASQQVGQNLPLYLTLFNDGDKEQVLDGVTTVEAQRVVYREGDKPPAQQIHVAVPPKGEVSLQAGDGRPYLELVGIKRQLGATTIPITFHFPTAGSVTVSVPVAPTNTPTPS